MEGFGERAAGALVFAAFAAVVSGCGTKQATVNVTGAVQARGDRMNPGETLGLSQFIRSLNGLYDFGLQGDGDVVVLRNPQKTRLWHSNTASPSIVVCTLREDGNFVVTRADGSVAWSTNTSGNPGSYVVMQNDGNAILYRPDGVALIGTGTGQGPDRFMRRYAGADELDPNRLRAIDVSPLAAVLNGPTGVARTFTNKLFISEAENNRVIAEAGGRLQVFARGASPWEANLILNPTNPSGPSWTWTFLGIPWVTTGPSAECPTYPQPFEGSSYFAAGSKDVSGLSQTVSIKAELFSDIDAGAIAFVFSGYVRSRADVVPYIGWITVEFLDANRQSFAPRSMLLDSGAVANPIAWQRVYNKSTPPVGTRFIRVSLLSMPAERPEGVPEEAHPGAFFDALSLIAVKGTGVKLHGPHGIVNADTQSSPGDVLFVANTYDHTLVKVSAAGTSSTSMILAGAADMPGTALNRLDAPTAVAVASNGNLYIADYANHRVLRLSGTTMTVFAGTGTPGWSGDGGPATAARLNYPIGVAIASAGNVLIADRGNNVVRRVATNGIITTRAGTGVLGNSGDGGLPTQATFKTLESIAVGPDGYVYISDVGNHNVRGFKSGLSSPITTVMGYPARVPGVRADGDLGPASLAWLESPSGLHIDRTTSDIFIADPVAHTVRVAGCNDADACSGVESYSPSTSVCVISTPGPTIGDNNACTLDTCDAASGEVAHGPVQTDDHNPCTADSCDAVAGTRHTPVAAGTPCTGPTGAPGTCDASGTCATGGAFFCPGEATTFQGRTWCSVDLFPQFTMMTGMTDTTETPVTLTANVGRVQMYFDDGGQAASDSMRFFYTPAEGDVEITVRVGASSADVPQGLGHHGGVQAGVMIRDATNPKDGRALMGAGWVIHDIGGGGCSDPDNVLNVIGSSNRRMIRGAPLIDGTGSEDQTRLAPPFWLRLTRIGKDYAIARARDAGGQPRAWVPLGGGVMASDEVVVGVFIGSLGSVSTGSFWQRATFDTIIVGPPAPTHRTSWIGSSFAAVSTEVVTRTNASFYVAPDGTSYKAAVTVDNGDNINAIRFAAQGGLWVPTLVPLSPYRLWGVQRGGITGDGTNIFVANRAAPPSPLFWVDRLRVADSGDLEPAGTSRLAGCAPGQIDGIAAGNGFLYISDRDNNRIRVVDWRGAAPNEIPGFAVQRPGPLALDNAGNLWIIQTSLPYPGLSDVSPPVLCTPNPPACVPPQIICRRPDGGGCGPNGTDIAPITAVANPVALAISPNPGNTATGASPPDPTNDQLIVTDAGVNQNLRLCTQLHGTPECSTEIGVRGGALAGPTRGLTTNASGLRLFAPIGAGVDRAGNIYVADGAPGTVVTKLAGASGTALASLYGLGPEPGVFGPTSDGHDFYTITRHFSFDPSKTVPGSEWSPKGVNRDPFDGRPAGVRTGFDLAGNRVELQAPRLRRIDNQRFLFIPYLNAQMGLQIFRYEGEIALLVGALYKQGARVVLWIDYNGDGDSDDADDVDEITWADLPNAPDFITDVDSAGNIWLMTITQSSNMQIWKLISRGGLGGFARYGLGAGDRVVYPAPSEFQNVKQDPPSLVRFDPSTRTMYILGQTANHPDGCGPMNTFILARYDNWSDTADPEPRSTPFKVTLPAPLPDGQDDFSFHETDVLCGCVLTYSWGYESFDVAGDMLFVGEHRGVIHVHRASDLAEVTRLFPGPEMNGLAQWSDDYDLLRAMRRSNGEYLITITGTDSRAANVLLRWTPPLP